MTTTTTMMMTLMHNYYCYYNMYALRMKCKYSHSHQIFYKFNYDDCYHPISIIIIITIIIIIIIIITILIIIIILCKYCIVDRQLLMIYTVVYFPAENILDPCRFQNVQSSSGHTYFYNPCTPFTQQPNCHDVAVSSPSCQNIILSHLRLDTTAAISQTIYSDAFFLMKNYVF